MRQRLPLLATVPVDPEYKLMATCHYATGNAARAERALTRSVLTTAGPAGLAVSVGLLSMIHLGQSYAGRARVGNSIAVPGFALCLVVAAFECRSGTGTVLTRALLPGVALLLLWELGKLIARR
jgi:hypothetical protein